MENIIFEKIWEDDGLIELKITGISEFVNAYQSCYIQDCELKEISKKIFDFTNKKRRECYIQMGEKEGNYTPAFSMKFEEVDVNGHFKIEVDIEIADTDTRLHRCCFYVEGELGALERLGLKLNNLVLANIGDKAELYS